MTSIGKENRSSQCLSYKKKKKKNSKGEGEEKEEEKRGVVGGGTLTSSRKDWVEFYGCIK